MNPTSLRQGCAAHPTTGHRRITRCRFRCFRAAFVAMVLVSAAHAARVPLLIDATALTFHWTPGYTRGLSPEGPVAELGNLSLHLVPGLYGGSEERPSTVAVYDALPDAKRVFLATGYKFEAKLCGAKLLILNWSGTMGDQELTLINLNLTHINDRWRIERIILTRHDTRRHTTLEDVVSCASTDEDSETGE